jgi:hypothetical protein
VYAVNAVDRSTRTLLFSCRHSSRDDLTSEFLVLKVLLRRREKNPLARNSVQFLLARMEV